MTRPGGENEIGETAATAFGDVAVALSLLSADVLHEVTHTLYFLRLLTQEPTSNDGAEITRFAKTELERMQRMVRDLRQLKLRAPEQVEVSLSILVNQSIHRVQESGSPGALYIEARIPAEAVVHTDPECLGSALNNLLLDALERVSEGSPLLIAADAAEPPQLELSDEGEAPIDLAVATPDWRQAGFPRTPTFRRILAQRLLRHIGWSMSYERRAQRNVLRLTPPLPRSCRYENPPGR